jgi:hypothetical protein
MRETDMNELQTTIKKAYLLSEKEQNMLAKLIEVFIQETEREVMLGEQKKSRRVIGKFNGKYDVPDDIDFCNDEIAKMFGVSD